jgi:hypothetical protein
MHNRSSGSTEDLLVSLYAASEVVEQFLNRRDAPIMIRGIRDPNSTA